MLPISSFTQNLSSVLSDPKRSRNEINSFFTRHWGETYIPQTRFQPSYSIPRVTIEHFRSYLTTTAKKHRKCLKAKKALHKALARHHEQTQITSEEIPLLFMDPRFSLKRSETFEAVFLEPLQGKADPIVSEAEMQREKTPSSSVVDGDTLSRPESAASINPQELLNYDAGDGRVFRCYKNLNERLEEYHDLVGALLNNQLASKGEAFWTTVNSYGSLHDELAEAMSRVQTVRKNLQTVNEKIYDRTQRVLQISRSRENRQQLLNKLQDIACLRDAQITVQMLLNQNDYPKALECIETAQEVLHSDLKGVTCFRHLNSQLTELHKVIGKMLQEEFVQLIQKEFGRPCDSIQEAIYQDGQLNPIVLGLMRVKEYRFVQVLKGEVVEAVKNTLRQIVKNRILLCGADLADFDPSLGYNDQMRKMNFEQWFDSLKSVFNAFLLFAQRVQSIQELIMDNIEAPAEATPDCKLTPDSHLKVSASMPCIDKLERKTSEPPSQRSSDVSTCDSSTLNGSATSLEPSPPPAKESSPQASSLSTSAASILAVTCRTASQVCSAISVLTEHALIAAEERACRLLVAKSKDGFLERCTIDQFCEVLESVNEFVMKGRALILNGSGSQSPPPRSPLQACMQQQTTKFVARFHDDRKSKLGNILDSELWRSAAVPKRFQRIADAFVASGLLRDVDEEAENGAETEEETAVELVIDEEKFIVVGTALILMQMIGQYLEVLTALPETSSDLLLYLVELMKNFNSRSCQLILGAGALQLVGLKSISVKNLALASRCLQLVVRFIPSVKREFEGALPEAFKGQLRHLNQVLRDYNDHITEINNKLLSVMEYHAIATMKTWEVKGTIPSPSFTLICKQLDKFYNGLSGILPESMITDIFKQAHENFKATLKVHLSAKGITPHDSLTYGLVNQDYEYYIRSIRAIPCCAEFPKESISEMLYGGSSNGAS
ncbi:hypothetical protein L596_022112 [Steinernema carpocapsae]|uniref:Vacuolar protein sorting-associated protein 54 n=1 Tax=Steinernema carpocapsae TaxID=34508 RepID=A0A4U5ML50_STECR|nr:hypothetical protein L596_022112 [Steinernema carpocapsae]